MWVSNTPCYPPSIAARLMCTYLCVYPCTPLSERKRDVYKCIGENCKAFSHKKTCSTTASLRDWTNLSRVYKKKSLFIRNNKTGWYRYRPDSGAHGRRWARTGPVCVVRLGPLHEPGDHPVRPPTHSHLRVRFLHGRAYFPARAVAGENRTMYYSTVWNVHGQQLKKYFYDEMILLLLTIYFDCVLGVESPKYVQSSSIIIVGVLHGRAYFFARAVCGR